MTKKSIKNTKTEQNLKEAFCGESQARNKYTYYASQAKKDGYVQISKIFEETAGNEKEHAELGFKALHGDKIPSTTENLLEAAVGEHYEGSNMYKHMAIEARKEGFIQIANMMEGVAKIESIHEQRYRDLLKDVKEGIVFKRNREITGQCQNCGHQHNGKTAPSICPVCSHPQAYFQELPKKNY